MSITLSLQRIARSTPNGPATICGNRKRTHGELLDRVARLASGLGGLGVGRGDRVAIISLNSDRYLESLLAISWSAATFTPLNFRLSIDELAYLIENSGSAVLFVDDAHLPVVEPLRARCSQLCHVIHGGELPTPNGYHRYEDLVEASRPIDDASGAGPELAGLFYTGGTTGTPKGVMLSHTNLLTSALGTLASGNFLTSGGTILHVAPLFHLAGIWPWLAQMLIGGPHVVLGAFAPKALVDAIEEHAVTDVMLVPTMIQLLAGYLESEPRKLSSLRHIIYAGSPIPEALLHKTELLLPHVAFTQGYGMTELAPLVTLLLPHEHVGAWRRSCGRAAPHALVRVVDPEDREVPRGQVGEIVVRGPHVMQGYWKQPELTATTLRGGWMHTGDAGTMDEDGFLYVRDRLKDMIITGGENVYSAEVENVVCLHPAVAACAVIGIADDAWGERVHAVVVLKDSTALTLEELREYVASRIARYKAPRSLEVVPSLPVSSAGKVLKRELRLRHERAR